MKRLTNDAPKSNLEVVLNYVYGAAGWACIRSDGEYNDIPLTTWAVRQCDDRGCDERPAGTHEEIDQEICDCMMECPDCPVALAYCFASQACHLRSRLKQYEDILFAEDGTELISLAELRQLADNVPLTLEQLREMDGEPVWCVSGNGESRWGIVHVDGEFNDDFECYMAEYGRIPGWCFGLDGDSGWLAYRRRPMENLKGADYNEQNCG